MITKKFTYHPKVDFNEMRLKVSNWADRKQFGIQHSFNRSLCILTVNFWTVEQDGPDHGGTARQIEVAEASLVRILARCAPKEIVIAPLPPLVQPKARLLSALAKLEPVQEFLSHKAGTLLYSQYSDAMWEIRRAIDKL